MLDALRRHSRSFLTWLVFGFLIAVFVIGFGTPASNKLSCGEDVSVGRVGDRKLSREDMLYAFQLMLREDMPPTARAYILDLLLRRAILAQEARRLGFQTAKPVDDASEDPDVVDLITHRKAIVLGFEQDLAKLGGWRVVRTKDGKYVPAKNFDYDHFTKWVKWRLRLTVPQFMRQQQEELLAKQAAETIMAGVQLSERELRDMYAQNHHVLVVQTALFEVSGYRPRVFLSPEAADDYAKTHPKEIDERYKEKYEGRKDLPRERWVRHIFLRVPDEAKEAQWEARRVEAARLARRLTAENFPEQARTASADERTRAGGGVIGWMGEKEDRFGKAFAKAVFEASLGKVTGPVRGLKGWHLILVEAERQGSWPKEQARRFLAYELMRDEKAEELARRAARDALARAKAGQADLKEILGTKDATSVEAGAGGRPEVKEVTIRRVDATVPGLEEVPGLASKLWAMGRTGVYSELVEVKRGGRLGALALLWVKEEKKPDWKAFEQMRELYAQQYLRVKQIDVLNAWVRRRCNELASQGKIRMDSRYTVIRYTPKAGGDDAKTITLKYHFCKQLPAHASDSLGQF